MPFIIHLSAEQQLAGITQNAARPGGQVSLITQEFRSSEDGDIFISRLEQVASLMISWIPSANRPRPSQIDHMLAVILSDGTAQIYINELSMILQARAKRSIEKGNPVSLDDIANITSLSFDGVEIPENAGIIVLFSHEWRKGLFFDFRPLSPKSPTKREYDITTQLGSYYAYLAFQDLYKISDDVWETLLQKDWFPFIGLKSRTNIELLNYIREKWDINELMGKIRGEILDDQSRFLDAWSNNPKFSNHVDVLTRALKHYVDGDYISACGLLYPRIEGVLRSHHVQVNPSQNPSPGNLVSSAIDAEPDSSMLLPKRFEDYLKKVYFAAFHGTAPANVSRHSVAHGVASPGEMDLKTATRAILTLDQLSFYIS